MALSTPTVGLTAGDGEELATAGDGEGLATAGDGEELATAGDGLTAGVETVEKSLFNLGFGEFDRTISGIEQTFNSSQLP